MCWEKRDRTEGVSAAAQLARRPATRRHSTSTSRARDPASTRHQPPYSDPAVLSTTCAALPSRSPRDPCLTLDCRTRFPVAFSPAYLLPSSSPYAARPGQNVKQKDNPAAHPPFKGALPSPFSIRNAVCSRRSLSSRSYALPSTPTNSIVRQPASKDVLRRSLPQRIRNV